MENLGGRNKEKKEGKELFLNGSGKLNGKTYGRNNNVSGTKVREPKVRGNPQSGEAKSSSDVDSDSGDSGDSSDEGT